MSETEALQTARARIEELEGQKASLDTLAESLLFSIADKDVTLDEQAARLSNLDGDYKRLLAAAPDVLQVDGCAAPPEDSARQIILTLAAGLFVMLLVIP